MENQEIIGKIFDYCQFHRNMCQCLNDFCRILQNPEMFLKNPYGAAHMKIGENTFTSVKQYYNKIHEICHPDLLANREAFRSVYRLIGEWAVCDECHELTICTMSLQHLSQECVTCRATKWVDHCCDKSEYLDAPIMRHYLQTGKVDPLLKWMPEKTFDDLKDELFRNPSPMSMYKKQVVPFMTVPPQPPMAPIHLKPMTEEEKLYLAKQFYNLGLGDKISEL